MTLDSFWSLLDQKNRAIAQDLTIALQTKDPLTRYHSEHVAVLMGELAKALQFEEKVVANAYLAGLVHDVGKIAVPDYILNKSVTLTDEEFEVMKTHSERGADFLENLPGFNEIGEIARHHHERFNGSGYPHGLKGEEIPFFSRMLTICDSYDAMTSLRSYKQPISKSTALAEISACSGRQFDPNISRIFIAYQQEQPIDLLPVI